MRLQKFKEDSKDIGQRSSCFHSNSTTPIKLRKLGQQNYKAYNCNSDHDYSYESPKNNDGVLKKNISHENL